MNIGAPKYLFLFFFVSFFVVNTAGKDDGDDEEAVDVFVTEKELNSEQIAEIDRELSTLAEILEQFTEPPNVDKPKEEVVVIVVDNEAEKEEKPKEEEEKPSEGEEESNRESENESVNANTPEEAEETSPESPVVTEEKEEGEKEEIPEDVFAVSDADEKVCILAKFNILFTITYSGKRGDEKAEVKVPSNANVKGKCESNTKSPLLQISWHKYAFTMTFNKTDEDNWILISMELNYDTSQALFDGAVYPGKKTARSKALNMFETPMGKSYFCPAQEVILMYTGNKHTVTAHVDNIQVQPYSVEGKKFSPLHRCNKVVIDGPDVFIQDETVPLAVGCTLALITLIILVGFSIHRAYNAAKAEYNSMAP